MAAPDFESYYQASVRAVPGITLEKSRELYEKRYSQPGIFTQGPAIDEFVAAASRAGIDEDRALDLYEKRYNTLPWYSDVGRGVKRALGGFASTAGGVAHALGAEEFGQTAMDYGHGVQQRNMAEANLSQEILREDGTWNFDVMKRPSWWAQGIAETGTSMAPMLAGGFGGAALAGRAAGALTGGAIGGAQEGFGGTYASRLREGIAEDQALREGLAMTGATAGLNALPLARILGRSGGGLGSRALTGLMEGVTELAEEPTEAIITGEDPLEATRRGLPVFPLAAVTGGLMQGGSVARSTRETTEFAEDLEELRGDVPRETPILRIATAAGSQIEAQPELVELESLVTSDMEQFPGELQPRDRDRDASVLQINEIANNLDPARLGPSSEASYGAPIVGPDNIVESGNARTMAIRKVYQEIPENAQAYRAHLETLGFDTTGFTNPVLISRRTSEIDRKQFTLEANQSATLNLGAAELARADSRSVDAGMLSLYEGGDLDLARNTPFVQSFLNSVPASQRNDLVDERGRVSQVGIRRIQGALLARAYGTDGDLPGLSRMLEASDDNTRAITGGLIDAAPYMAELRQRIQDGQVAPEYDISAQVAEAAQAVSDARRNRQSVEELLAQGDAFTARTPLQDAAIRLFAGARSRAKVSAKLRDYAAQATREGDTQQQGMFAGEKMTPEQLLGVEPQRLAARIKPLVRDDAWRSMKRDNVLKWTEPVTSRWRGGPNFRVLRTFTDLPQYLQVSLVANYGELAKGIPGLRDGDDIYLIADKINNKKEALAFLSHEAVGHFGMETMLGPDEFANLSRRVLRSVGKDADITRAAQFVRARYGQAIEQHGEEKILAPEIIAHLAENNVKHPLLDRAIARIREFLRQLGIDVKLTRRELNGLLVRAARQLERPGASNAPDLVAGQAMPRLQTVDVGRHRVTPFDGPGRDRPSKVSYLKNPSLPELKRFMASVGENDGFGIGRNNQDNGLRFFETPDGDMLFWDASEAMHHEMTQGLMDQKYGPDSGPVIEDGQYKIRNAERDMESMAWGSGQIVGDVIRSFRGFSERVLTPAALKGRDKDAVMDRVEELTGWRPFVDVAQPAITRMPLAPRPGQEGGRTKQVDVLKNPTLQELRRFASTLREGADDGMRVMETPDGDFLFWDSMDGLHSQIAGGQINQGNGTAADWYDNPDLEWNSELFITAQDLKGQDGAVLEDLATRTGYWPGLPQPAISKAQQEWLEQTKDLEEIQLEGDTWRIIQRGATLDDGSQYLHLASTTQGDHQKNGWQPRTRMHQVDGLGRDIPQPAILDGIMRNLGQMSRTFKGVADDAGSATKAAAMEAGAGDQGQAVRNVRSAWELLEANLDRKFTGDPEQVRWLVLETAKRVTKGQVKSGQLIRKHDVKGRYMPASEVPAAFRQFGAELMERLDTQDPKDLAAWIHRRFNHEIHPFADGVGKTTELLADWALARRGHPLPVMPDRTEFYNQVEATKGDLTAWTQYFRTLFEFTGQPAIRDLPKFEGRAFRAPGFEGGAFPNASAFDVYEVELERGNVDKLPQNIQDELKEIPAKAVMFVGRTEDALLEEFSEMNLLSEDTIFEITDLVQNQPVLYDGDSWQWILVDPEARQDDFDYLENQRGIVVDDEGLWDTVKKGRLAQPMIAGLEVDLNHDLVGFEAEIQESFYEELHARSWDEAVQEYQSITWPENTEGGLLNTVDAWRELSEEYKHDRSLSRAVHEIASAAAKKYFHDTASREPGPGEDAVIVFLSGGPGVGKSSGSKFFNGMFEPGSRPMQKYETNMTSLASAQKKIDFALEHDKDALIVWTYRDVIDSFKNGVVPRALESGRTIDIESFVDNHLGSLETAKQIRSMYKGDSRVRLLLVDNDHGYGNAQELTRFSVLPDMNYDKIVRELKEWLDNAYQNGYQNRDGEIEAIPQHIYEGLTGQSRRSDAPGPTPQPAVRDTEIPRPENRDRLEVGGGSYSPRQFASLDAKEYQVLQQLLPINEELTAFHREGRDPKSWSETERLALEEIVKDPARAVETLAKRMPGDSVNRRDMEMYGQILIQAVKDTKAVAMRAAETKSPDDLVTFVSHMEKLAVLQAPHSGAMTEAGRTLNILRKSKEANLEAMQILEQIPPNWIQGFPGGPTATDLDLLGNMAEQIAQSEDASEIANNVRKLHEPKVFDKVYEYWVNSILSGLNTHAVNNISNGLFQILENTARTVGAALPGGAPMSAALARWSGGARGIRLGAKLFRRAFITGDPQMGGSASNQKIEAKYREAIPGAVGNIVRIPGRALLAEDEFWKAISYYAEVSEAAEIESRKTGRPVEDILANIETEHPALHDAAVKEAHRLTFTTEMGPALKAINRGLIKSRLGKFIAPFIRTPSNILKEAVRFTPGAGALIRQVREDMAGMNGSEAKAVQMGRWIVGTMMYATVGVMTAAGKMSGAGPDDPNERRLLQRTGWQPYSIKVGDKWIRYNRFEPVGMILGLGADGVEIGQYAQGGELDKIHAMVLGSLMNNLADKTFLSGVFDFAEAMSDPQRYMGRWVSRMAQSFAVPNIVGQAVWTADPFVREARTITDRIHSRLPGKRRQLNELLDVAGEPIPQTATMYGAPFNVSEQQSDPVAEAMLRLGIFKGKPGRTLMGVKLDDDVYSEYASLVGKTRWQHLSPLVNSPQFRMLMDNQPETARYVLEKAWSSIGNEVRKAFLFRNPEILVESQRKKREPRAISSNYLQ